MANEAAEIVPPQGELAPASTQTILSTTPKEVPAQPVGDQGAAPKTEPGSDAPPAKSVVPEKYDLKLPEGSRLSAAHLEEISALAKEKGLSQEQAQLFVERENSAVTKYHAQLEQSYAEQEKQWVQTAQSDKEIGGENLKVAAEYSKRVLEAHGSEELRKQLNESRLGNHPELLRLLYRVGKAMHPKGLVMSNNQGAKRELAPYEKVYGSNE